MKKILFFLFVGIIISGYSIKASAFNYNIFTDVTFTGANGIENNLLDDANRRSFVLGEVDFFFVERVSDRIDTMGEVVIMNHMGDWHLDVERIQIGYMFSDLLNVKIGKFHNIISYWNTRFHHGTHLQNRKDVS
ncbi:MAG: hypothetical protein ACE5EA_10465 [Nitrospirota bacterium]